MSIDELPGQFEEFVERARGVLNAHITEAREAVTAANNEKTAAQNALADLQASCKSGQDQLAAVMSDLQRLSSLVGVGHDLARAKAELEKLYAEKAALEISVAALAQQRSEGERQVNSVNDEMRRLLALRSESEASISHIRGLLRSVQIGDAA